MGIVNVSQEYLCLCYLSSLLSSPLHQLVVLPSQFIINNPHPGNLIPKGRDFSVSITKNLLILPLNFGSPRS